MHRAPALPEGGTPEPTYGHVYSDDHLAEQEACPTLSQRGRMLFKPQFWVLPAALLAHKGSIVNGDLLGVMCAVS
jgi:hypothetical protein